MASYAGNLPKPLDFLFHVKKWSLDMLNRNLQSYTNAELSSFSCENWALDTSNSK